MKLRHAIHRAYIAIARGESFRGYADWDGCCDIARHRIGRNSVLSMVEWRANARLEAEIERLRGRTPEEQYRLGIIDAPGRLANLFICRKLVERFGLENVAALPNFDEQGILRYRRCDLIYPVRERGWITHFSFYSLKELEKRKVSA